MSVLKRKTVVLILNALLSASVISKSAGNWQASDTVGGRQGKFSTHISVQDGITTTLWSSLQQSVVKNHAALLGAIAGRNIKTEPNRKSYKSSVWPSSKKAVLEGKAPACANGYFLSEKGLCQQCRQCKNDEVKTSPCSGFSDAVCRPAKHKYTRCIILLKRRHSKKHVKRFLLRKAIRPGLLRRCFRYLARYLLELNVKRPKKDNVRSKRDSPSIYDQLSRGNKKSMDDDETKKFPEMAGNETRKGKFPELAHIPIAEADSDADDIETQIQNGQAGSTSRPQLSGHTDTDDKGISPWIYAVIAIAVAMLLATSFVLTLLYRRRQRAVQQPPKPNRVHANNQDENAHSLMYDTQRSGSTDKGTERSKSTVSTYLSNNSRGDWDQTNHTEFLELMPLNEMSPRERSSVMDFFPTRGIFRKRKTPSSRS